MEQNTKKLIITATFSAEFLTPALDYHNEHLKLGFTYHVVPYNQTLQELLNPGSMMSTNQRGLNVILLRCADWLRFQGEQTIPLRERNCFDEDRRIMDSAYEALIHAIHAYSRRCQCQTLIVISPSSPDSIDKEEWQQVFSHYRARLTDDLQGHSTIKCLAVEDYHDLYEVRTVYDPIGDTMGHIPYTQDYVHLLSTLIVRYYHNLHTPGRKVIVADCDQTLWNGVCGEVGAQALNWDGAAGRLQEFLVRQSSQGMLICLCSKNAETDVWEVFDTHPDMPLQREHIVAHRINWAAKSENIKAIAQELNLGLDSFIFIDDNPVECSEVTINCPGVVTIQWPPPGKDPVKTLTQMWIFDHFAVTSEDKERTRMYQAEIHRRQAGEKSQDWRQFIAELELQVEIEEVTSETLDRVAQLTMRTNQFNFTTTRRTAAEIKTLHESGEGVCRLVKVQDRFGIYGIVGVVIDKTAKSTMTIDTFLLSCRVLGRGVEHRMVAWIAAEAEQMGLRGVRFLFRETTKNLPAQKFLDWLRKEYSGKIDRAGSVTFSPEKLRACCYTYTPSEEPAETVVSEVASAQSSFSEAADYPTDIISHCRRTSNICLLTDEIRRFRQNQLQSKTTLLEGKPPVDEKFLEVKPDRETEIKTIRKVFHPYASVRDQTLTPDFPLEQLALSSKDIVLITSELYQYFPQVSTTLLFECRTFGEVCDQILPQEEISATSEVALKNQPGTPNENAHHDTLGGTAAGAKNEIRKHLLPGTDEIAVIGIGGRFPCAGDIYEFWANLVEGCCHIGEIPRDRWDHERYFSTTEGETGKSYNKWGGFLNGIDKFEAGIFKITPLQAALMDPQQRLFLEVVWNTLEDAGYHPERFEKKTGVFVGVISSDYGLYQNQLCLNKTATFRNSEYYQIANRISYFFDFHGPSLAVDTACSASGTALHLACESIRAGSCRAAIAGGVNLVLHPSRYVQYAHVGMLSRDGLCRPFAALAGGMVIGEGIAGVILKPYREALKDGDHIWGVIKGSAINSGGRTTGFTVPSPLAQSEVVAEALQQSGVDPATISYVEAHGTGTPLGDPIEIKGLSLAFQQEAKMKPPGTPYCVIGSVKSNIGHLESAAAMAGIIKVLLQMKHRTLVPSLHAENLNAKIDFSRTPFKIQQEASPWVKPVLETSNGPVVYPLRAGVSSFGPGGSNAHIILEAPENGSVHICETDSEIGENGNAREKWGSKDEGKHIILLSARDKQQLNRYITKMLTFLRGLAASGNASLHDYTLKNIAYTLRTGRKAMEVRLAVVARSITELIEAWSLVTSGEIAGDYQNDRKGEADLDINYQRPKITQNQVNERPALLNLITGNAGRAFVRTMIREDELEKLAEYWTLGGEIPEDLFDLPNPRRLSLPGYPFDGETYRMEGMDTVLTGINPTVHIGNKEAVAVIPERSASKAVADEPAFSLFQKTWRRAANQDVAPQCTGDTLIVGGNHVLNQRLIHYLKAKSQKVILLAVKNDLPPLSGDETILVHEAISYDFPSIVEMTPKITASGDEIGRVIYLVAYSSGRWDGLKAGFLTIAAVYRELLRDTHAGPRQFLSLHPGEREATDPFWGGIAGFGKTVMEEDPELDFRSISVRFSGAFDESGVNYIMTAIQRELEMEPACPESFYDGGEKWIPYYTPIHFGEMETDQSGILREGGTYLITGGLGGIGLALTEWLATSGSYRLILCGRSPRDEGKLMSLRKNTLPGSRIAYFQTDITDAPEVEQLISHIQREYGGLNGIFHLAGVTRDAFLRHKNPAEMAAVFAPKVQGTLNLDAAVREEDLDFFLLFSSLSGVLGNAGQSDYAYANSFLESFRDFRNRQVTEGTRKGLTISIAWPYWRDGGMKLSTDDLEHYSFHTGLAPLPVGQGMEIIRTVFARKLTHVIPCYGNQETFARALNREAPPIRKISDDPPWDDAQLYPQARAFLQQILGEVVKMNPREITEEIHFEDLGIDSISVQLFSHQVEKKIGKVNRTLLYECQSLRDLTQYFAEHYRSQLIAHFNRETGNNRPAPGKEGNETPGRTRISPGPFTRIGNVDGDEKREIAIIGMSGCFPLARDLEEFWQNLKKGRDCITRIPKERWDHQRFFAVDKKESVQGKYYCEWGGFLEETAEFDPLFFHIAPKEARGMDPQERLFLEYAWMALEDAGYNREELKLLGPDDGGAPVGVFVGVTTNDYQLLGLEALGRTDVIGHSLSWSIANRVSYCLNLNGPSIPVDAACASSLTAVHFACESLLRGECEAAIVGAVNLFLHPFKYILNSHQRMLSAKGRCFTFSAAADGFVPAEGVGAIIFKRLDQALEDGDHIYAVIKGTAINHGGRSNGYMVPTPDAQARVIEKALRSAAVNPRTVSYLEAHGTGTILGDPVEISGLCKVFEQYSTDKGYCAIGSVKSNIGHAEAAAGLASLLKVILQMRHQWIVPSLYTDHPNPNISFPESPFFTHDKGGFWSQPILREGAEENRYPRRAGISSFGAGGANAHLILEEYPEETPAFINDDRVDSYIFILSAATGGQLREYAGKMVDFLQKTGVSGGIHAVDLAFTMQVGRKEMKERLAVVFSTLEELLQKLAAFMEGTTGVTGIFAGTSETPVNAETETIHGVIGGAVLTRDLPKLAALWVEGPKIPWRSLYTDLSNRRTPRRISLPTYPFISKKYELGPAKDHGSRQDYHLSSSGTECYELTGGMARVGEKLTEFTGNLSLDTCDFLKAHILFGQAVLSGPTQLAMLLEGLYRALGTIRAKVSYMDFIRPIVVSAGELMVLKLVLTEEGDNRYKFGFKSKHTDRPGADWTVHSSGRFLVEDIPSPPSDLNPAVWMGSGMKPVDTGGFYLMLESMGYSFEDSFKCIVSLEAGNGAACSLLQNFDCKGSGTPKDLAHLSPGMIDSCIQMLLPTLPERVIAEKPHSIYVPVYMNGFTLWRPFQDEMRVYAKRELWDEKKETFTGSLLMVGLQGEIIGYIHKFRLKRVDSEKLLDTRTSILDA